MEIQSSGSAAEVYGRLKTRITELRAKGKLSVIRDIRFDDSGLSAQATGSGFRALIACADGKVSVDLKLGLLLRPMRGQIEEGLRKRLQDALA
ncbi:MAG: polyhydroxyalkanoic acid system family protein [Deltaproteobacteria bacterium]|nr:polyhydroxyalkanoic acid system family protein [Deltaproteobacteria bacterium]